MKYALIAVVATLALAGCKVDLREMPSKPDSQVTLR
jgi:hypothetical protein